MKTRLFYSKGVPKGQMIDLLATHRVTLSHPVNAERPAIGETNGKVTDVILISNIFAKNVLTPNNDR